MRLDSLVKFANQIGLGKDELSEAERLQRFYLRKDISVKELKNISITSIKKLITDFGDALLLWIGYGDTEIPLIKIESGIIPNDLEVELGRISRLNDTVQLLLVLKIEKKALLRQLDITGEQYHSMLYIFKNNLIGFISSPLPDLDGHLFLDRYKRTIVLLLEENLYYSGPFLTIVSESELKNAKNDLSTIDNRVKERVEKYHATAQETLNWRGFQLEKLTPLHFLCNQKSGISEKICKTITTHLLHLCILYTANRSVYKDKNFHTFFTSKERTSTLLLGAAYNITESKRLLAQLAIWPYSGKEDERLNIFQTIITRKFDSEDPNENYFDFCNQLNNLFDEARWHYKIYMEGRIDKHFEQIQKVTNYVAEVAREVAQILESVTKGFTDTLLASVGIIVLTMLASFIKEETQGIIFKTAMWAYAGYLFIFQGLYRLGSIWHSYHLLKKGTDERLDIYANTLGKNRVDNLISPIKRRKKQFLLWFFLTIFVYAIVIIFILLLGYFAPKYLGELS